VCHDAGSQEVNVAIIESFVRLRAMLATHADLARRLNELEQKYDEQFRVVFEAIRELKAPEPVPHLDASDLLLSQQTDESLSTVA
jgi:hypothetical protein